MSVYAVGSIAGVDQKNAGGDDFKILLLDAANFRQTVAISTRFAVDGTPVIQTLPIGAGRAFGVQIPNATAEVLDDTIDAITTAVLAGNTFPVALADDLTTINHECLPDGTNWLRFPGQKIGKTADNEAMVKDVEMRFIAISEVTP